MEDLKNEFVPYELAVKLKELGFDEHCLASYYTDIDENYLEGKYDYRKTFNGLEYHPLDKFGTGWVPNFIRNTESVHYVSAPTFRQAFRWFRKKYKIITEIRFYNNGEEWEDTEYKIIVNRFEDFATHNTFVKSDIKTYEEAELICLDTLIRIVELGKKWDELYNTGLDEPLKEW